MKEINEKKKKVIILLIFGLVILCFWFYINRTKIEFKQEETKIEYGSNFSYEDCIQSTNPKDLKIKYPQLVIKEVGKYEVIFKYGKNFEKQTTHTIVVKDTVKPKINLKIDKRVETHINKEYEPLSNIESIENIEKSALDNKRVVTEKEYNKIIKNVKQENKRINSRLIKKKKDIHNKKIEGNFIIAFTNLDLSKKGIYEIKMAAVDENLNVTEIQWKIKVVDQSKILNRGGKVVCSYPADTIEETESIVSDYKETFFYDKAKNVINAVFEVSMRLKEDYDTEENLQNIINELNKEYAYMNNIKGVDFNLIVKDKIVYTMINVDFTKYNSKKDELELLINKEGKSISINETFKNAENNASCVID